MACLILKQSSQGSLKSLNIQKLPTDTEPFQSYNHQKWFPYQIIGVKNHRERKNLSTNNGDMVKKLNVS